MKITTFICCVALILTSCESGKIKNLKLNGEPTAKNIIWVSYELASPVAKCEISWFISDSQERAWIPLPGIYTREIVLLTEYSGKYLKCEVMPVSAEGEKGKPVSVFTSNPIVDKGNPNTDWFKDAGVGVMLNFLKPNYVIEGGAKEWNEVVDGFDVELFAENCREAGARFVMFALGQNSGYYCTPNTAYDSIVGVPPGELCSNRDLPADLYAALEKRDMRMMFYLPGNPPIKNKHVTEKFQYTYRKDSPTSQFTQECWEAVIREWSLRYGKKLSGWWFDGMYRGGIIETRSDMSLDHNISTHTLAAKAGNYQSIVTYNYGVKKIQSNSPYDDYSAGEERKIGQVPDGRWVTEGVQWFLFTYLGKNWGGDGVRFETDKLTDWAEKVFEKEGVLCFDINADKSGAINPAHIEQVKTIRETFENIRNSK